MKFVSIVTHKGDERLGLWYDGDVIDVKEAAAHLSLDLPATMAEFLKGEDRYMDRARRVHEAHQSGRFTKAIPRSTYHLLAPVPHPTSCRDGYAFRQHVATARRNRGLEMIPEFDQFPVFYFTNHHSIFGPGDVTVESDHLQQLDFELEAAIVIGKRGRNIETHDAHHYIAGFMVMNDLSARVLQMDEMKLSLGPAKGKDFATALGPWLVTPDEIDAHEISTPHGNTWDLQMKAFHNGKQVSDGNMKEMNWTFAEIIERASYGVDLYPGDVIGSGTVGTGCYLELNGSGALRAKERGEKFQPTWLQAGDTIELEITGLGKLKNVIKKAPHDHSILARKRTA
ncbi:MAG: fumarylacetoacetate hydrolase family protein [Candidatus Zixiibacteriota bacterium]